MSIDIITCAVLFTQTHENEYSHCYDTMRKSCGEAESTQMYSNLLFQK